MKKTLLVFLFLISLWSYGQNPEMTSNSIVPEFQDKSIRPLRVGLRVGFPNIGTVNAEYVTPLLDHRVAITADFMAFKKSFEEGLVNFTTYEVGTNIYFNNSGRGFYGALSFFSFSSHFGFEDYHFYKEYRSDGYSDFKLNTYNVKLGYKVGRTVYFRTEIGYGFGSIPNAIVVESTDYPISVYEDIPDIPGVSSSGILIFNIGFGVSFF